MDAYRIKYEDRVRQWESLRAEGVSLAKCAEFVAIKTPKHRNKSQWGEAEKQLVFKVRRDNKTYGKEKIGAILRRDNKQKISDSTVGRILGFLRAKGVITRSGSAPQKRKRNFSKGHAKGWKSRPIKSAQFKLMLALSLWPILRRRVSR